MSSFLKEALSLCVSLRTTVPGTGLKGWNLQVFVSSGEPKNGCALSKQHLSNWIGEAIGYSYRASDHALPSGVKGHSTRSILTSWKP